MGNSPCFQFFGRSQPSQPRVVSQPLLDSEHRFASLRDLRRDVSDSLDEEFGTLSMRLTEWRPPTTPEGTYGRRRRRAIVMRPSLQHWTMETLDFLTNPLEVDVSTEETTLHSAMKVLSETNAAFFRVGALHLQFRGQVGVDSGGLRRDFFARMGQVLCQVKHGFLLPAADGQMQLRPSLANGDIPMVWWEALGKLLASSVLHKEPLGIHFVIPFCKQLLGAEVSFDDLKDVHPDWFRAMRSLRKLQIVAASTLPEDPCCMILQMNGTHGTQPGEKVLIQNFDQLTGEHEVLCVTGLQDNEIAISFDNSISQGVLPISDLTPPVLRRYASEDVNAALSSLSFAVPSRGAIVQEHLPGAPRVARESSILSAPPDSEAGDRRRSSSIASSSPSRPSRISRTESPQLSTNNFEKYITAATCKLLCSNVKQQLEAMKTGFEEVIGHHLLDEWKPAKWPELRNLLRGQPCIDLAEWRRATTADGFLTPPSEEVVHWWFHILERAEPEFRRLVLRWSTGLAAVPCGGWPIDIPFVLAPSSHDADHLPSAHTCSYTVDIPQYACEMQLESKLRQAVVEFEFGFG